MESNKYTLSFSSLKQFEKSPSHFLQYKRKEFKSTPAMRLGTLTHLSILEPEEYHKKVVVTDLSRRTKAFKEFEAENESKEIITTKEESQIKGMTISVKGMKKARKLLKDATETEKLHSWKYRGHVFHGIPDAVAGDTIIDLKTTKDATPRKFEADAFRMLYHMQAAAYMSGLNSKGYDIKHYYIIAVETTAPYPVTVFKLSDELIERGFMKLDSIIDKFEGWDGVEYGYHEPDTQIQMNVPEWAQT